MRISEHFLERLEERFDLTLEDIRAKKFERVSGADADKIGLNSDYGGEFLVYKSLGLAIAVAEGTLITALYVY